MINFAAHPLIETDWLAKHLTDEYLRIIDMRWRGNDSGRELYLAGHIHGAIYLDWHRDLNWTDERGVRDLLIPSERFAEVMSESGIDNTTQVVAYAETDHSGAASVPLQQALRHLERAYVNFFEGRTEYPTFKKKRNEQSATYASNAFTWDGSALTLAKMEAPLPIVWHRPLPKGAMPSSVTVSKDSADRYFVSILVREEIANPKYYRRDEKKLAKAQRKHAHRKKGSKNREKARRRVARLHARIVDRRRDYQHQLSTRIMHENQVICVESLAVKNMVKNHALAKSISDVGWGEFVQKLDYKATWYGRTLVKIDRWIPSTKTCHVCKHILPELDFSVREWVCPNCGTIHQRDHNAAKNVLTENFLTQPVPHGIISIVTYY